METFKEIIARDDATLHYYVYLSYRGWQVDVIQFNDISDVVNEYYKNKTYYNTYDEACVERDRLNIEWEHNKIAEALNNMEQS